MERPLTRPLSGKDNLTDPAHLGRGQRPEKHGDLKMTFEDESPTAGAAVSEETTLVRQILAGDEKAKSLFYKTYAPRIYPICVHFLGYKDPDAEDMAQETFLLALTHLKGFEGRSSLYTWLARICVNLCLQRLRKREKTLVSLQEDLEKFALPLSQSLEGARQEAETSRRREELLERVSKSLSEKCRNIIDLRDHRGESYIQIAKLLRIPIGTVMSQLARCREALKRLVENEMEGGKA